MNGQGVPISLQNGFRISVFAQVSQCRGLAVSPDGVLYATSYSDSSIYALPDHRHLGKPDSVIRIVRSLAHPHGLGFLHDTLYFSTSHDLDKVVATNSDRSAKTVVKLLSGFNTGDHITHTFVFDTVRQKILMQKGSPCNYCTTSDTTLATIMEYNYDGTGGRIYARGLRNAVGLDLDPRTNLLWTNVNGMDDLFSSNVAIHDTLPREGIYLVCDGANYGWPYAYSFRMRNPEMMGVDTSYIQSLSGPVAEVLAHEAPLGLHFYRGTTLPPLYHHAIFQAVHGSWDASPPAPPRVIVMWADSDGKNARFQDFMTGFQYANGSRWGRCVEVTEGPDSALYVSDDQAGAIYRITYVGPQSSVAKADGASLTQLYVDTNFPNPFHGKTTINYTLRKTSQLTFDLFDDLGRKVRNVLNAQAAPGSHSLEINCSDLPAGSYYLRASGAGVVQTVRLVIE